MGLRGDLFERGVDTRIRCLMCPFRKAVSAARCATQGSRASGPGGGWRVGAPTAARRFSLKSGRGPARRLPSAAQGDRLFVVQLIEGRVEVDNCVHARNLLGNPFISMSGTLRPCQPSVRSPVRNPPPFSESRHETVRRLGSIPPRFGRFGRR